ncbi:hypothetical protein Pmani_037157 [Petrolisthes manimaculis]|uniref:Uncharacterized protein n=1 Tax=Petrolisthes manimaculis TaxID=1843537 RepID=A0AAE1TLQ2_9EUCA|nr:hypothetical protein Pmani_037157 [Petrolisthes manimaculis]
MSREPADTPEGPEQVESEGMWRCSVSVKEDEGDGATNPSAKQITSTRDTRNNTMRPQKKTRVKGKRTRERNNNSNATRNEEIEKKFEEMLKETGVEFNKRTRERNNTINATRKEEMGNTTNENTGMTDFKFQNLVGKWEKLMKEDREVESNN